ncbi:major facilitator superfamily domain-containing protein [Biscogniauxia mediterranea]|nr:major facilitator superfamily domain-containing protein [Biscogniauxia mediterranea]
MKGSEKTSVPSGQFDAEAFNSSDMDKIEEQEARTLLGHALSSQDGGWEAWLVLFGAFVVTIATFGLINSFGVFQTYYETELLSDHSSSAISWIGSLQGALLTMFNSVSRPLYDMVRLFLVIFSLFMTSLCSQYWQRRAIAIGIQTVGSPLGGIVFSITFSRLQPTIGFAWATRVIAFILLGTAPIPLILMRPRVPAPKHKRAFIDSSVFTDLQFLFWGVASFFAVLGLYVPFFYIQLFAIRYRLTSLDFSAYLVTLLNAAFGWFGVENLGELIVFALLYGLFSGGITSLPQSAIVAMTPDMSHLGTRMGMASVLIGLAVLIRNPIAGAILRNSSDTASWRGLMAFTMTTLLASSVLYLPS